MRFLTPAISATLLVIAACQTSEPLEEASAAPTATLAQEPTQEPTQEPALDTAFETRPDGRTEAQVAQGAAAAAARRAAGKDPIQDWNGNGIDDAIDISYGNSLDVDCNGIPDEAEAY